MCFSQYASRGSKAGISYTEQVCYLIGEFLLPEGKQNPYRSLVPCYVLRYLPIACMYLTPE